MRKRYFTINYKLPAVILILIGTSTFAKDKEETNIICFAAKNKWVCAPEGKQELASKKAEKLIEKHSSEQSLSDVVIKSIKIPKFNSTNSINTNRNNKQLTETSNKLQEKANKATFVKSTQQIVKKPVIKELNSNSNPYAKLWSHQLIGLSSPQSAINFIRQKDLNKDDILVIKSTRAGMDWWIVLYGLYKNKSIGLASEANLPVNLDKPWLRPLKNLEVNGFIEKF